jgi:membrane-associated protease RseP (regulator of RpoE activity)
MKKELALWSCAVLLLFGSLSGAGNLQPYLGVSLDSMPLPELLVKHLRLDPGQGLRINNITVGSPADQAGLERDDILCAIEGGKVASVEQLVEVMQEAGVGAQVTLEVIRLGQRLTVSAKLEPASDFKNSPSKYPPQPDGVSSWRPGRIFKIEPQDRELLEVPFDKIPEVDAELRRFFRETYTYHHSTEQEDYTVTIEGDPADQDSRVVVDAGGRRHDATVGDLDKLPEKYRAAAREAVEDARTSTTKDVRVRKFQWPDSFGPDARRRFFQNIPRPDLNRLSEQKDLALQRLQEQMERLQQHIREMDERHREMFDQLLQRNEARKSRSTES